MEISELGACSKVKPVHVKPVSHLALIKDTVEISGEGKKIAEWVEMLKSMPDIRPEKIEAALQSEALQDLKKACMAAAENLQKNLI